MQNKENELMDPTGEEENQIENSQLDNESDDLNDEESEDNSNEESQNDEISDIPNKKKGKSRNARFRNQIDNLRQENEQFKNELQNTQAQMAVLMQMNGQQSPDQQQNNQGMQQGNGIDFNQAMMIQKANSFENDLNNLRQNDEEVDDILSNSNHPIRQLQPDTIQGLQMGIIGVSPKRLFDIVKSFPKEIKKVRSLQNGAQQLAALARLDGKLGAMKDLQINQLKKSPDPTGVLKGGSANITTELSPEERYEKLKRERYGKK